MKSDGVIDFVREPKDANEPTARFAFCSAHVGATPDAAKGSCGIFSKVEVGERWIDWRIPPFNDCPRLAFAVRA